MSRTYRHDIKRRALSFLLHPMYMSFEEFHIIEVQIESTSILCLENVKCKTESADLTKNYN